MILSDVTVLSLWGQQHLGIDPFQHSQLQGAGYDLTLSDRFRVFSTHGIECLDPLLEQHYTEEVIEDTIILHPGQFILGSTIEYVELPDDLVGRIEGKSSLGRLGLIVHATAGFIDPGFHGQMTLEMANQSPLPIKLHAGMLIAQIVFQQMDQRAAIPYAGKYMDQRGPQPSSYYRNYPEGLIFAGDI